MLRCCTRTTLLSLDMHLTPHYTIALETTTHCRILIAFLTNFRTIRDGHANSADCWYCCRYCRGRYCRCCCQWSPITHPWGPKGKIPIFQSHPRHSFCNSMIRYSFTQIYSVYVPFCSVKNKQNYDLDEKLHNFGKVCSGFARGFPEARVSRAPS